MVSPGDKLRGAGSVPGCSLCGAALAVAPAPRAVRRRRPTTAAVAPTQPSGRRVPAREATAARGGPSPGGRSPAVGDADPQGARRRGLEPARSRHAGGLGGRRTARGCAASAAEGSSQASGSSDGPAAGAAPVPRRRVTAPRPASPANDGQPAGSGTEQDGSVAQAANAPRRPSQEGVGNSQSSVKRRQAGERLAGLAGEPGAGRRRRDSGRGDVRRPPRARRRRQPGRNRAIRRPTRPPQPVGVRQLRRRHSRTRRTPP